MNGQGVAVDIVVLAGDRGPDDPVAAAAGTSGKVLAEVGGKPMLRRVLEAAGGVACRGATIVVAPDRDEYRQALQGLAVDRWVTPDAGPAASVLAALDARRGDRPFLLLTGDHPLMRTAWLDRFLERARAADAHAVVGLARHAEVRARLPDTRRTRYRFADVAACGTNLFYFSGERGRRVVEYWRSLESQRKRPWKVVARVGWLDLLRYLLGRLTLDAAVRGLSRRVGARVSAVFVDDPLAAVDVDTPEDLALVRGLFEARKQGALHP